MDILLKQRLVGAIVLISLAVIFLPMLFTGTGKNEGQKFESSMPVEPTYEIKSPQVSVPLSIPTKPLETVPLSEPREQGSSPRISQPPAVVVPNTPENIQKPAVKTSPPKPADREKPDTTSPAAKPANGKTGGKPHSPTDTSPQTVGEAEVKADGVTGWIVQVGSFSRKSNAEKLRDKLRKLGMASFVAAGMSDNRKVYRVRVGPEIDRAEAENLQARIKEKTKLTGLVMKYP